MSKPVGFPDRIRIGLRVGRVINRYKVAKHFTLDMQEQSFSYQRKQDSIALEAALDGIYVVRTSVAAPQMDSADCVRSYKRLADVERAFRSLKTIDLKIRPIHHHLGDRVRAHNFLVHARLLCRMAYAGSLAGVDVCRRGSSGQEIPRPGCPGHTLRRRLAQNQSPSPRGWLPRP